MKNGDRSYDPWWDNRRYTKTVSIETRADVSTAWIVTAVTVSNYRQYPSPGVKTLVNGAWQLKDNQVSYDRMRGNKYYGSLTPFLPVARYRSDAIYDDSSFFQSIEVYRGEILGGGLWPDSDCGLHTAASVPI